MPHNSRKPHKKTRTGCTQCKGRRIKCDETKPACVNCVRYHVQCSYVQTFPTTIRPLSSAPNTPSSSSAPSPALSNSQSIPAAPPSLASEIKDLELLHFYTTTTALSLSNLPDRKHIWQWVIPQLAFSHHCLMHGILAISAFHLARVQPARKEQLLTEASQQHASALSLFRSETQDINPSNCEACFAFSSLLVVDAWSSSGGNGDLFFTSSDYSDQTSVEWVTLIRGVYHLLLSSWSWVESGPLQPLMKLLPDDAPPPSDLNTEEKTRFDSLTSICEPTNDICVEEAHALKEAVSLLRTTYAQMIALDPRISDAGMILSWTIQVPELYLRMVRRRQPPSLVVLAHYALLLHMLEDKYCTYFSSHYLLLYIFLQSIHLDTCCMSNC
ncbi:hypothetical protein B0J14DRAFT_112042 [Halenospora varia]|nr:hypothetical protein B0J14DRAFT_112042 [Halenospora varia]